MSSDDITLQVLIGIRDEIREMREDIRGTNARLDLTNERLDLTNERLESGLAGVQAQLVTGFHNVREEMTRAIGAASAANAEQTRDMYTVLQNRYDLRDRVEKCERDIHDLKQRVV